MTCSSTAAASWARLPAGAGRHGAIGLPPAGDRAGRCGGRHRSDAAVKAAYDQYKGLNEGKNADYIPALAQVPSNYFGIAVVDAARPGPRPPATSSRCSRSSRSPRSSPLALVMQESGDQQIEDTVGVDATGQVFNSIIAVEQYRGKEMNPLVNPGAIATVGNVKGGIARRGLAQDPQHPLATSPAASSR